MSTAATDVSAGASGEIARVRGVVFDGFARAAAGARVVAVDRDLRSEQPLGEAATDEAGRFEIGYTAKAYSRAEAGSADVVVRVLDAGGATLAQSDTMFNAPSEVFVILVIPRELSGSEFARVLADVEPVLDGAALASLSAADVDFLSRETHWDPARLGTLVAAAALAGEGQLSLELLYGLLRSGLPRRLPALAALPDDAIRTASNQAAAQAIISADAAATVDSFLKLLRAEAARNAADPGEAPPSALSAALSAAVGDPEARRRLAQAFYETGGGKAFWKRIAGDDSAAQLQRAASIAATIGSSPPLIRAAVDRLGSNDPVEGLTSWQLGDWLDLVRTSGVAIPSDLAQAPEDDPAVAFAQALADAVADQHPQAVLSSHLTRSRMPGASALAGVMAERPDLDLQTVDLTELRDQLGPDAQKSAEEAAKIVRVYRISPRSEHVEALINAGLDSALKISRIGRDRFIQSFGDQLGTREAAAVHKRAQSIHGRALAYLSRYWREFNRGLPAALAAPQASEPRPSWSALFGSLDFCDCPDCRSALSPAAYLVDLLQFVAIRGGDGPLHARDALLTRRGPSGLEASRGDIEALELSCGNTNTELPTIDLVIELCEAQRTHTAPPVRSSRRSEELALQPEYVNDQAYRDLVDEWHPWPLPLDRPWEELRSHLGRLVLPRDQLIETLRRDSGRDLAAAGERLSLSPSEITHVIQEAVPADAGRYFGLAGDWVAAMTPARAALAALRIEIDVAPQQLGGDQAPADRPEDRDQRAGPPARDLRPTLLALLATWFVRANGGPTLHEQACDLAQWSLHDTDPTRLWRLERFLRLQRRSGWTIGELDALLHGLGATDITANVLTDLGHIRALMQRLNVSASVIALWWGLPTDASAGGGLSPFEQVYCDPVRVGRVDQVLSAVPHADPTRATPVAARADAVRAALGVTGSEFAALVAAAPAAKLTVPDLTALWREVSLARALSLPVSELLALRAIDHVDILAAQTPTHVRALVDLADRASAWGLKPSALLALLQGTDDAAAGSPAIDTLLGQLQKALATARAASHQPIALDATTLPLLLGRIASDRAAQLDLERFFAPAPLGDTPANRAELERLLPALAPRPAPPRPPRPPQPREDLLAPVIGRDAIADPHARLAYVFDRLGITDPGVQQLNTGTLPPVDAVALGRLTSKEQARALLPFFADPPLGDTPANRARLAALVPDLRPLASAAALLLSPTAGTPNRRLAAVTQRVLAAREATSQLGAALAASAGTIAAITEELCLGHGGPRVLDILLSDALAIDGPTVAAARRALRLLAKALAVATRLGLTGSDFALTSGANPAWPDLSALPAGAGDAAMELSGFALLADFFTRRRTRQRAGANWSAVLTAAVSDGVNTAALRALLAPMLARSADAADATAADLQALCAAGALGLEGQLEPWRDGRAICWLDAALERIAIAGVSAQVALSWVAETIDPQAATAAVQAVRARYPADQWPAVERPLRDVLRERQRDALVAALLGQHETPDDLSARLLIDVAGAPCLTTSRIEAAMGSVQTFVQRCLLGLEDRVRFSAEGAAEWEWMQRYDLWVAQRKVFLYPEDYLHPELRDDKTPFFVEFEQQLGQGALTPDRIETLYGTYLEALDSVAKLNVCGCYHEQAFDTDGTLIVDRLHVVARTAADPRRYWYRRLENGNRWTPWESIGLDIDSEAVVVTVAEGRLYLCWPVIKETGDPQPPPPPPVLTIRHQGDPAPAQPDPAPARPPEPRKHLEIQLAYAQRKEDGWGTRQQSDDILRIDRRHRNDDEIIVAAAIWLTPENVGNEGLRETMRYLRYRPVPLETLPDDVKFDPLPDAEAIRLVAQPVVTGSAGAGRGRPEDDVDLVVRCYVRQQSTPAFARYLGQPGTPDIAIAIGEFRLGGCHGTFTAVPNDAQRRPALLAPSSMMVTARGADAYLPEPEIGREADPRYALRTFKLTEPFPDDVDKDHPSPELYPIRNDILLVAGLSPLQLVLPQGGEFLFNDGFFVEDNAHRFYVHPTSAPAMPTVTDGVAGNAAEVPPAVAGYAVRKRSTAVLQAVTGNGSRLPALEAAAVLALATRPSNGKKGRSTAAAASATVAPTVVACPLGEAVPVPQGWLFEPFEHPYSCRFLVTLRRKGVDGLLQRDQQQPDDPPQLEFTSQYDPTPPIVATPPPQDAVDFSAAGAYSIYNWELFVHAPLRIARQLHNEQKFAEALRWYERVFDPTTSSSDPVPARYWKPQPFYDAAVTNPVDELRLILTGSQPALHAEVEEWRRHPFEPWRIARLRRSALPKAVVIAFLDLLLDWGDANFRQFTRESVRQADTLYSWAAQLLGPRPAKLPATEPAPESYSSLANRLNDFSDAIVAVEEIVGGRREPCPPPADAAKLRALETTFYFCIPPNERLLGYWDKIAARLFKIRHCQDINGVVRPQPLYEPPIDPDLLVRAAAAGVDLATVGADAPLSPYRFPVVLAKALELAGDIRALGAALLGAFERRDGEELARLRSTHELAMLDAVRAVRAQQQAEAESQRLALARSQDITTARRNHYADMIGAGLLPAEIAQLALMGWAWTMHEPQAMLEFGASVANLIPDFDAKVSGWGGTPEAGVSGYGGSKIGAAMSAGARVLEIQASEFSTLASIVSTGAGYQRRQQEWQLQVDLADLELKQLEAQLAAADIRIAIAKADLANHDLQRRQAAELDQAMRTKFTNLELYTWTAAELSTTYFQAYGLALEAAHRAERAYAYEHPEQSVSFITPGGFDGLHAGLLAGERLQADLRRMEAAWLAANNRDYELTKHISLALHDPLALIKLRSKGKTCFTLPEALFDADHPGHYMRRIKAITLTVPAVVGPYTSVNCELALTSSEVRIGPDTNPRYERAQPPTADSRFRTYTAAVERIATSRGHGDAGVFELSFRDERYLPFEGAGVVNSNWTLTLDPACNDFDLQTVSDIIIEIQYTAREGGEDLRSQARSAMLAARPPQPPRRLFSARTDFADAWQEFLYPITNATPQTLRLTIDPTRFPFRAQQGQITIRHFHLALVLSEQGRTLIPPDGLELTLVAPYPAEPGQPAGPSVTLAPDRTDPAPPEPRRLVVPRAPVEVDLTLATPVKVGIQLPTAQLNTHPQLATEVDGVMRIRPALLADILVVTEYTVN